VNTTNQQPRQNTTKSNQIGSAILEFVIGAPLLLLFSITLYDVVGLLHHHAFLTYLAREGARVGASAPSSLAYGSINAEVSDHVTKLFDSSLNRYSFLLVPPPRLTVNSTLQNAGRNVRVVVTARYRGISPMTNFSYFSGGRQGFQLSARAEGPRV
jgi:Flp pilus assembly protein TadG